MNYLKNVYSNLVVAEEASLPANPKRGQCVFVDGALQIYATMDGSAGWVPLTNPRKSYVHQQAITKVEWIVDHGLNSDHLMYSAYDANGDLLIVNKTTIDSNMFKLSFSVPIAGYVIVMSDSHVSSLNSNIVAHLENRISELDLPNIVSYEETDSDSGEVSVIYDFQSMAVSS